MADVGKQPWYDMTTILSLGLVVSTRISGLALGENARRCHH